MKPTLEEIKDNYERVLLQLENGHLAGIKKFSLSRDYNVVEQQDWSECNVRAIELSKGYKSKSVYGYNIDRIKFLSDRKEVDNFLQYEECEIDWDWDINNPHNLKFKKGDVVRICHEEFRQSYKQVLGKVGTIVEAEYTQLIDDERITYRVCVDDSPNDYQANGLWVFHDESSLELYEEDPSITQLRQMSGYIDDCIAQAVLNKETTINTFNIKGDNNNMNNILEIYVDRRREKINKKYDEVENSVKLTDARYKVWKECVDTLDKLYTEDKICNFAHSNIKLSEDTNKKLHTLYAAREEEFRKLLVKRNEVDAQLSMCETYDQKQEILRRYNIINKNGKING